ncbi:U32 family peptidase [Mariniblastus sp.]|mgnify:FL=1|nr:U32 family peptidase [Mariniblastus sp.]MDB4380054.1 U32 family peptidase [Mariniblastus sp.]
MSEKIKTMELMSPAGYWPELQTAIEAGADAVYFGLKHFSARGKVGFALEALPEVVETLHARGVKAFVTFNTLVFEHEFETAETAILAMAAAGVDAVIVQDLGIASLIHQIAPELIIHGSTQMSITSAQGAELAKSVGCRRVVLGRELSLSDIKTIAKATDIELEVFVHGALCVSYSGQCFSSEAWGGRSANRGKCAQACRFSYDLIVDGEERDLGAFRYLLSPGDLFALDQIPELLEIGISCVKIEGRYKDSEYVGLTTQAYREAIDLAMHQLPVTIEQDQRLEIEQIYSRGLGPHFISGTNHQTVVNGRAPRHRGIHLGEVTSVSNTHVEIRTQHPVNRGDGLVFDAADWRSPDEPEEGGHVYEVRLRDDSIVELEFGHHDVDFSRIRVGDLVWRTRDPQLVKSLKPLTRTEVPIFTREISFEVTAKIGEPISIIASNENGQTAQYLGDSPLQPAQKRALDLEILHDKLGRLGGTPFHLKDINLLTEENVFVPTSELNQARRQMVDQLFEDSGKIVPIPATPMVASKLAEMQDARSKVMADDTAPQLTTLHVLVRSPIQLDAAIESLLQLKEATPNLASSITLDYLELYGLRPSIEKIKEAGIQARVASPRILKPSEQKIIRFLLSLNCDILVRSGGLLYDLIQTNEDEPTPRPQLIGDFSLNAANSVTAWTLLDLGVTRVTPGYDLNSEQIEQLTERVPPTKLEVIAYSHLPVFHMEHCVFCRFLSDGTDNTNCGHPCEKHQIAVRDSQGRAHPVMADVGCRNTIFGAEAQTNPHAIVAWRAAGISDFRLEFVHQTPEQVSKVTSAFGQFLSSEATEETAGQLAQTIEKNSPQSTTEGSLFVPSDYKNLVQLS